MQSFAEDMALMNGTYSKHRKFTEQFGVLDLIRRQLADNSRDIRALVNVKMMLKEQEKEDGEK